MPVTSATLDKVINKIGSPYNVRLGSMTFDVYGAGSVTFTQFSATGYVQILSESDESTQPGVIQAGDAIGYFKLNNDAGSVIKPGSLIEVDHQGETWQMYGDPIVPHLSGNQLLRQINLRKKTD